MKYFNILLLCFLGLTLSKNLRFLDTKPTYADLKGLDKAGWWVDSICKSYQSLLAIVSYGKSKTLKAMWNDYGFNNLDVECKVKITQGVDENRWGDYINVIKRLFKIPAEYQDQFQKLLEDDDISDDSKWIQTHLLFDPKNPGTNNLRSFNFMFTHREIGVVDSISLVIDIKFDLSPLVFVYQYSKSIMGGAYTKIEDKIEKRPASLSEEQLQNLLVIAGILGYRYLGMQLGIHFQLPEM